MAEILSSEPQKVSFQPNASSPASSQAPPQNVPQEQGCAPLVNPFLRPLLPVSDSPGALAPFPHGWASSGLLACDGSSGVTGIASSGSRPSQALGRAQALRGKGQSSVFKDRTGLTLPPYPALGSSLVMVTSKRRWLGVCRSQVQVCGGQG